MSVFPDHIETQLRDEIARSGMILLEIKRRGERGSSVIEIIVDSEAGVMLDQLAELSRWAGALLDEAGEAVPGRYRLEVSSAGLDRPLEHPWQYRKNVGRLLKATIEAESGTRTTDLYELVDLNGEDLVLTPLKKGARKAVEPIIVPLRSIVRAVVEPRF